jgi:hypothetical protein
MMLSFCEAVIASEAKQAKVTQLFWIASSLSLLAMTRDVSTS